MKLSTLTIAALIGVATVTAVPVDRKAGSQATTVQELPSVPRGYHSYRPGTTFDNPKGIASVKTIQKRDDFDPHAGDPRYAGTWVHNGIRYRHKFSATAGNTVEEVWEDLSKPKNIHGPEPWQYNPAAGTPSIEHSE